MLMKDDASLRATILRATRALCDAHAWKQSESWAWELAIAHLFRAAAELGDFRVEELSTLFSHGCYPVQMVVSDALIRSSPTKQTLGLVAKEILLQLGSHNFLSDWCCALQGYFSLFPLLTMSQESLESLEAVATCRFLLVLPA